eukprot:XP_024449332.1 uncharacterized protein LOC18108995 [Populus trichocarpa]
MAVQPAAKLSPVPEFPSLARRATGEYNGMAYSFGSHMGGDGVFVPEINALSENVQHNAQEAVDAAGASASAVLATEAARDDAAESAGAADGFSRAAAASAGASAESAGAAADSDIAAAAQARLADDARRAAQDARDHTEGLRDEAEDARDAAQAYRDQAEVFATKQLVASSTTSVAPGAGAKSFLIEASRSFVTGMYLVATSQSDPNTRMSGYVQSYNGTTGALVIAVDAFAGAGLQLVVGGRTIIAKAGRGAIASATKPVMGPRGGYGGTGGDLHIEGGPGGSVIATTSTVAIAGSGAVGILQNPPADRAGGDINTTGPGERSAGAGVGGKGGSILASAGSGSPSGGGSGGPGVDVSTATSATVGGPNFMGQAQQASPVPLLQYIASQWGLDVFGGGGTHTTSAGPGGGAASNGSTFVGVGYMGGPCGHGQPGANNTNPIAANGGAGGSAMASGAGSTGSSAGSAGLIVLVLREA